MRPNLAERAGRWSAAHWKTATFGWLAFVAIAFVLGNALGVVKLTDTEQATGETARAERMLNGAGFADHAGETVLVQSHSKTVSDPAFKQTVNRVVSKLETLPTVRDVRSPLAQGREGQLSADRHSALVQFSISGSSDTADTRVEPVLDEVAQLQQASPGFVVRSSATRARTTRSARRSARTSRMPKSCPCRSRSSSCCSPSAPSSPPASRCCSPSRRCSRSFGLAAS